MSKESLNRAQRRRIQREAKVHVPAFWDSMFNRVWVIGLAIAFVGVIVYSVVPKTSPTTTAKVPTPAPAPATTPQPVTNTAPAPAPTPPKTDEKVKIEEVKAGTGPEVKVGDTLTVQYTGKLPNGTQFDSSVGKAPLTFTVGKPGIIEGWNQGFLGMKQGGKRKITVPPSLGYGAQGKGDVPPNATMIFDVELLKIESK